MTIETLFSGGGVSLSPLNGDGRYASNYVRITAGEGKTLTNGEIVTPCIDVLTNDVSLWQEIDDADDEDIDNLEAFGIIFGDES